MADTTSKNVKIVKFEAGSRVNTWKPDFDTEIIDPIDSMFGEKTAVTVDTLDVTLSTTQFRSAVLGLSGTLTGDRALIMPGVQERGLIVDNRCSTGIYNVQAKQDVAGAIARIPYGPNWVHWDGSASPPTVMPVPLTGISVVASAATCNIGQTPTPDVQITGTTGITSFGYAPVGTYKRLIFTGAVLITYNVSTMILPGAVNYTTSANDTLAVVQVGTGNNNQWQVIASQPVNRTLVNATTAQIRANTAGAGPIDPNGLWNAANEVIVTYTSSWTPDMSTFINALMILTGNLTLNNPTNVKPGQSGCIRFAQDASGSRVMTSWGTSWAFQNSVEPGLTATANANDCLFYYVVNSTFIICSFINAVG